MSDSRPLAGVRVLDLSTLLPGPLATLVLADAGADVVKIERPGVGDEMRTYEPKLGSTSANYALLNRGKRAFAADMKNVADRDRVLALASRADVVIEQFRPSVAARLGIGYDHVRETNPRVVYCSITGYGQNGPLRDRAGHDLNYIAQSGLLSTVTDNSGSPQIPVSTLADIAGGTYPAVISILLALRRSEATGEGSHLDISIAHNLQVLAYGTLATKRAGGDWPRPSGELLTGGSPRYQIYPTADARHVAVASLEQKFWDRLSDLIGLTSEDRNDVGHEDRTIAAVAGRIASQTAAHWRAVFETEDVCATVIDTFDEAVEAGLVELDTGRRIAGPGYDVAALRTPIAPSLLADDSGTTYPELEPLPDAGDMDNIWASPLAARPGPPP